MGTSSAYGGPSNGLVPDWVDDEVDGAGDGVDGNENSDNNDTDTTDEAGSDGAAAEDTSQSSPMNPKQIPQMSTARGSYTRFTNSGNLRGLSKALSNYSGSAGGSAGLTRRMPNSVHTSSRVASFISGVANVGATEALRQFNLQALAGQSAVDVFDALMDELCPAGGTIDEAVARDAYIDALVNLEQQELGSFDQLTEEQLNEFLADVITGSILSKVINEIGTNSLHGSANDNDYENAETVLRDYTAGAVRDELERSFSTNNTLNSDQLETLISDIFTDSFDVLQAMLEADS